MGSLFLPAQWDAHFDPQSGETYYFNTFTGESSWEHPGAPGAALRRWMNSKAQKLMAPTPANGIGGGLVGLFRGSSNGGGNVADDDIIRGERGGGSGGAAAAAELAADDASPLTPTEARRAACARRDVLLSECTARAASCDALRAEVAKRSAAIEVKGARRV